MAVSVVTLVRLFLLLVSLEMAALATMVWWRRKQAPVAWGVVLLLISAGIYAFSYGGELGQTTVAGANFWRHAQYLGIPWIPALWIMVVRKHNRLPNPIWIFCGISVLILVAEMTNSWHGLYVNQTHMVQHPPFSILVFHRGPLAWVNLIYLYGALLYGDWVYLSRFRHASWLYRKQSLYVIASSIVPLGAYLAYLGNWSPWGLDLAPVAMSISAILAYFAVVRLEFFDLVPMSHSLVFASMRDAVLVTDMQFHLVDLNPAAHRLLPSLSKQDLGKNITQSLGRKPEMRPIFDDPSSMHQVRIATGGILRTYEVRILSLGSVGSADRQVGWAILWADVTAQLQLVRKLRHRADTDELTGVANRRAFSTTIKELTAQTANEGYIFSLILVDIDHFKQINDQLGHGAGDCVLKVVTRSIDHCLRQNDFLCRYGGDEFAVLLPGTGKTGTVEVAERIREKIARTLVEFEGHTIPVSASLGVSVFDATRIVDKAQLMREADMALYRAKAAGKNRVGI
jgi:diguanylate cyclase (GGDEF)-like protein